MSKQAERLAKTTTFQIDPDAQPYKPGFWAVDYDPTQAQWTDTESELGGFDVNVRERIGGTDYQQWDKGAEDVPNITPAWGSQVHRGSGFGQGPTWGSGIDYDTTKKHTIRQEEVHAGSKDRPAPTVTALPDATDTSVEVKSGEMSNWEVNAQKALQDMIKIEETDPTSRIQGVGEDYKPPKEQQITEPDKLEHLPDNITNIMAYAQANTGLSTTELRDIVNDNDWDNPKLKDYLGMTHRKVDVNNYFKLVKEFTKKQHLLTIGYLPSQVATGGAPQQQNIFGQTPEDVYNQLKSANAAGYAGGGSEFTEISRGVGRSGLLSSGGVTTAAQTMQMPVLSESRTWNIRVAGKTDKKYPGEIIFAEYHHIVEDIMLDNVFWWKDEEVTWTDDSGSHTAKLIDIMFPEYPDEPTTIGTPLKADREWQGQMWHGSHRSTTPYEDYLKLHYCGDFAHGIGQSGCSNWKWEKTHGDPSTLLQPGSIVPGMENLTGYGPSSAQFFTMDENLGHAVVKAFNKIAGDLLQKAQNEDVNNWYGFGFRELSKTLGQHRSGDVRQGYRVRK